MSEPKYRDEEWLREQYVEKEKTTRDIASECCCVSSTVSRWLEEHGIEGRGRHPPPPDERLKDGEWLREQYTDLGRSTEEIGALCGCHAATIARWLHRHGIDLKESGRQTTDNRLKDREWVREQYVEHHNTTYDIAEECGCCATTVGTWLEKHGIKTRSAQDQLPDDRLKDRDWLREQYVKHQNTTYDIAEECRCSGSTVLRYLELHGIETRRLCGENHPHWNGGFEPYGTGWNEKKKQQVRKRDGYKCVDCGTTQPEHKAEHSERLHVHHLIKARDVDDPEERNALENLVTLCRDCHREWERVAEAGIRPQIDGVTAD